VSVVTGPVPDAGTDPAGYVHVQITEFTVAPAPLDEDYAYDWAVKVEWRGGGAGWAVTRNGRVLNVDGEWEYESLPSERDEADYARCRFDSDTALRLAAEVVPKLVVNGKTWADWHARAR
jgi:hypothetical protein